MGDRIHTLYTKLFDMGITIRVTQGLRSWNDQNRLYAQGRTTPGRIVTRAKGGESAHNFGYAVDFVVMTEGFPDWDWQDAEWTNVLAMALEIGLDEGAQWRTFPDYPHLYLEELPPDPDDEMRLVYHDGGMIGLWRSWTSEYNIPYATSSFVNLPLGQLSQS